MMKFDEKNVVQSLDGDTLSIGVGSKNCPCCSDTFLISVFGKTPRTYHKGTFNKEELKKLGAIIARLTDD